MSGHLALPFAAGEGEGWEGCSSPGFPAIWLDPSPALPFATRKGGSRNSSRDRLLFRQQALVQVQRVARVLGRERVVGDHHDGLAVVAVERLQQAEDLRGGLPVEV